MEILLLRLGKESARKCSLTPLRGRADLPLRWLRGSLQRELLLPECTLLHPGGEPLGAADAPRPLLLLDCSWRDLPRLLRRLRGPLRPRRLVRPWRSAYPRASRLRPDPPSGLASVEALHAALCELGRRDDRLIDAYPWRRRWLELNQEWLPP